MAHRPIPVPTGNKKQDRAAKSKYVNEHVDLIRTDLGLPTPQNKAKEIRSGKYTSGGKHLFGMQPVKGGFFTSEDPTTEDIPLEGPFAYAKQEANNIRWVINNKNISDQEKTILENIALDIDSKIILGIDRDLTYNNQVDRNNMSAEEFFGTGIDVNEENTLDSEQSKVQKVNKKVDEGSAGVGNEDLNKTKILESDPQVEPNPISTGYQRPSPAERQKRRMEDVLVRGRPGAKFKLDRERGRGTNVDDLFTKNRGR